MSSDSGDVLLAGYVPSLPASLIFSILFGVLMVGFNYKLWKDKEGRWMQWMGWGVNTMFYGFVIRIVTHFQPYSLGLYIITTLLVFLAPTMFLAQMYVMVPRLADTLGATDCLFVPRKYVVWIFFGSDMFSYAIQGGGGGLLFNKNPNVANIGRIVILVSMIFQGVSYAIFLALIIVFGVKLRSRSPEKWKIADNRSLYEGIDLGFRQDWKRFYAVVVWASVSLMIRTIYRIVEYAQGSTNGYLALHEVFAYCLDATPLVLVLTPILILWPPKYCNFKPHEETNMEIISPIR